VVSEDAGLPSPLPADVVDLVSSAVAAIAGAHLGLEWQPLATTAPAAVRLLYDVTSSRVVRFAEHLRNRGTGTFEVLLGECESDSKQQLFTRTIEAVRQAGSESQLYLLAQAFANGVRSEEPATISLETMIARTIGDLEETSLRVLLRFTRTASENGLSNLPGVPGAEEQAVLHLNHSQLQMVLQVPDEVIDALLANLEQQGLVRRTETGGGSWGGGGVIMPSWMITPFGLELGRRIEVVADAFGLT
jgi:hypothetical protein